MVGYGKARYGMARISVRLGVAGHDTARIRAEQGKEGRAWQGWARRGTAWIGAWYGKVW